MTQPHEAASVRAPKPGQMTAVMRAVAATGPKVLRIGVVRGGRVIEERVIKQRGSVTVGASEKSTFVVSAKELPASFQLFELKGDDYYLNFYDGMKGRVALSTGISDLEVLKGQARRTSKGAFQIRLSDDARGKVVIGDRAFLFQFVAPPPVQPKPQLPVSVTRGGSGMDWPTTIIAAFSFLAHFLAIGSLYSDWLDPIEDEELALAGIIDSIQRLPPPPPVEDKPEEKADETKAQEKAEPTPNKPIKKPLEKSTDTAAAPMNQMQVAALSNELEQLEMATLAALSSLGPATADVLEDGESVPTGLLDSAAESGAGVGSGSGDLKLGGGGRIRPGETGTLADIGKSGRAEEASGTGTVKQTAAPKGVASVGGAAVSGGQVSDATRVVAGMSAGFRACYQRGLNTNPEAAGSIHLTIRIGPGGEVQSVSGSSTGTLPASVVACVKARAGAAQFAPPEGGTAVIAVPVSFVKQN